MKELKSTGFELYFFEITLFRKTSTSPVIIVSGGSFTEVSGTTEKVWEYDLKTEFTKELPSMNIARWAHKTCIVD